MLPGSTTGMSLAQQDFQSKCLVVSQTRIFPVNIYLSSHCFHKNMTSFQLIAHQKEIDEELPSGVLQWMPKGSFALSSLASSTMV